MEIVSVFIEPGPPPDGFDDGVELQIGAEELFTRHPVKLEAGNLEAEGRIACRRVRYSDCRHSCNDTYSLEGYDELEAE